MRLKKSKEHKRIHTPPTRASAPVGELKGQCSRWLSILVVLLRWRYAGPIEEITRWMGVGHTPVATGFQGRSMPWSLPPQSAQLSVTSVTHWLIISPQTNHRVYRYILKPGPSPVIPRGTLTNRPRGQPPLTFNHCNLYGYTSVFVVITSI